MMNHSRRRALVAVATIAVASAITSSVHAQLLTGTIDAHDPSTLIKDANGRTYYFSTGTGILSRSSSDLTNWTAGPNVFATPPAWTSAIPGFTNVFWAPDVIYRNNEYYLYYAVSSFGSQVSGIGMATSATLDPAASNYGWTDHGPVIQSANGSAYNTIDPSILQDTDGRMYMTFGSYWNGIYVSELNPTTGLRLNNNAPTQLAKRTDGSTAIEASSLIKHGSYYYLFVNYDKCCSGIDSTYNIRVGRGTSPTGPFFDKAGVAMTANGGTPFLADDGAKIGPGHFSLLPSDGTGQDKFSFHYYDGDRNGPGTLGIDNLYWTADAWPSVGAINPDWSGASSFNWSTAANWSDGTVPNGIASIANFRSVSAGHNIVSIDGGVKTVSRINFNGTSSFIVGNNGGNGLTLDAMANDAAATINVVNGSQTIAAPITAVDDLAVNIVSSTGNLTLSGGVTGLDLFKYGDGKLTLGGTQAYSQRVLIHNGNITVNGNVTATQFTAVGAGAGDVGSLTVSNGGTYTANSDINVGDTGASNSPAVGTLTLSDTAAITVNSAGGFFIGSGFNAGSGATGTFNQTGGTLVVNSNFDGGFVIGGRASALATGVWNLSGGTATGNNTVQVGRYGTGTVNQTGGAFTANSYLSIGRYAGGTGTWTISAGALNANNASTLLIVGESGKGTLTVAGSGSVTAIGGLRLGHSIGGNGTVNLFAGGTITTSAVSRSLGSATFNFNGGTLRATSDQTDFFRLATTESEVNTGGAILDSNGHAVTITRALDGVGGVTKSGAGTLRFSVDQAYLGGTTVQAGSLQVTRLNGNGSLALAANATLTLDAPATPFDPAHRSVINGTLSLATSSMLNVDRNVLVIDYAGDATTPLLNLRTALAAGEIRGGAANASTTIGYADAATLASIPSAFGSVDATSLLVRATTAGDTNLDGTTDFTDLLALAKSYGTTTGQTWTSGDVNYDAGVDFNDLLVLAKAYGTTAAGPGAQSLSAAFAADWSLAQSLVPEPTLALIAAAPCAILLRRRVCQPCLPTGAQDGPSWGL